jgi:hypothetical protein
MVLAQNERFTLEYVNVPEGAAVKIRINGTIVAEFIAGPSGRGVGQVPMSIPAGDTLMSIEVTSAGQEQVTETPVRVRSVSAPSVGVREVSIRSIRGNVRLDSASKRALWSLVQAVPKNAQAGIVVQAYRVGNTSAKSTATEVKKIQAFLTRIGFNGPVEARIAALKASSKAKRPAVVLNVA